MIQAARRRRVRGGVKAEAEPGQAVGEGVTTAREGRLPSRTIMIEFVWPTRGVMAERFSFLALEEDFKLVTGWFADVPLEVTTHENSDRVVYYYRGLAKQPLAINRREDLPEPWATLGLIEDQSQCPLVFINKPQNRRRTLWTDGEVYFTPTPFRRQFPALHRTCKAFASWLGRFDLVFGQKSGAPAQWNYYLEGGIRNFATELFALPQAMAALRRGQYFVHYRDSETRLEMIARTLRLREYAVD